MSHQLFISENHRFFLAQNEIRELCRPFLGHLGVTYFTWLRFYRNGYCYFYSTHNNLLRNIFKNNLPFPTPTQPALIKNNFHFMVLPTGPYARLIPEAKTSFNLGHFINFVQQHEKYIDVQCFGADAKNEDMINVYLNNLLLLEKFKSYFEKNASHLLKQGESHRLILPESLRPLYKTESDNPSEYHFPLIAPYQHVKFTQRQSECVHLLIQGYSLKETALSLSLSPRTIEHYLESIKHKLNCRTKSQLLSILLKHAMN